MAQNGNTADRELLKAIEGADGKPEVKKKPKVGAGADPLSVLKSRLSFFLNQVKQSATPGTLKFSFSQVNKILFLIIALFLFWSVFSRGMIRLQKIPKFDLSSMKTTSDLAKTVILPLKDYAYYTDILLGRNIFNPVEKQQQQQVKQQEVAPRINTLIKNLKIVGISWSEKKKDRYVMIEDTKAQLTYYLQEGDKVSTLIVKEIFEDKAVLAHKEEEVELR